MSVGRRRLHPAWIAALAIPAASTIFGAAGQAAAAPSAAGHLVGLHRVAGTRPTWASPRAFRGPASGSAAVHARIWLQGRDPAGLAAFAREVSTPRSHVFHHYLSPAQFRARFGPSPAQRRAVISWARSAGLTVTSANEHYLTVSTTVTSASRAFNVKFGRYSLHGAIVRAPESDASVPSAVAADVLSVTGLDNAPHLVRPADPGPNPPPNRWNVGPCSSYYGQSVASNLPDAYGGKAPWATCGYTPDQFRSAYGATQSGLTGKGVTVAVVGAYDAPTIVSDTNQYSADNGVAGLAPGQYTENLPPTWDSVSECGGSGWFYEQHIDIEALHGMAPGANLVYVPAADCFDNAFQDALLRVVDNHLADIVSNSWADTEDQAVPFIAGYESIFVQAAAEGIGMYFSTGDDGLGDPNTPEGAAVGSDRLQVNYPASSDWVTAVGGTTLGIGANKNYLFETSYGEWRDLLSPDETSWSHPLPGTYPGDFNSGGTGGTSYFNPQPSYQAGVVPDSMSRTLPDGSTSSTPMRVVPDISMDGDPATGINIGMTAQQPDGSYAYSRARWGGTSLSAPLFAGMQAMAEQAAGTPIGFANPVIYQRYRAGAIRPVDPSSTPVDFAMDWYTNPFTKAGPVLTYLVTAGVDGAGASLLPLKNGYDEATGTGSPGYNYLESFLRCRGPLPCS